MNDRYMTATLPRELPDEPMHWAAAWLEAAGEQRVQRNPNSMTLATVAAGQPSARVVLCKDFVADPGYLVFYTNYRSRKALELEQNPLVAATFHWDALGRQIRLEGRAILSPVAESDAYFASRSRGSQLGAWASDQSAPIDSRDALKRQLAERAAELGIDPDDVDGAAGEGGLATIPRPPHWGGVRLWPHAIELWIEGADRIHDRGRWTRTVEVGSDQACRTGPWSGTRLQP